MDRAGSGMGDVLAKAISAGVAAGKVKLNDSAERKKNSDDLTMMYSNDTETGSPIPISGKPGQDDTPEKPERQQPTVEFLAEACSYCGKVPPQEVFRSGLSVPYRCQCRDYAEKLQRVRTLMTSPADDAYYRYFLKESKLPAHTPRGLSSLIVDNENRAAIEAAKQMVEDFRAGNRTEWLYLYSAQVGSGKTTISLALAFDLWRNTGAFWRDREGIKVNWGKPAMARWWNVPHMFSEWKKTFDDKPSKYDPELIQKTDCLLLDEFGNERTTEFNVSSLFEIVNNRYERQQSLVICSNYSPTGLAVNISKLTDSPQAATQMKAMMDRVRERAQVIELKGKSRRQLHGNGG